ncbi:MAG: transposase [Spirochaetes bacterium]|nr:transposase [Spirochaetota bacterium]
MKKACSDLRNPKLIPHDLRTILSQRIFGLCRGYEDINDHDELRFDPLLATACDKVPDDQGLAVKITLNRLELGDTIEIPRNRYKNIRYCGTCW